MKRLPVEDGKKHFLLIKSGEGVVDGKIKVVKPIARLYKKYGNEYRAEVITITREDAFVCLENGIKQRDLNKKKAIEIRDDINGEKWIVKSGEALGFSPNKRLSNGQTRLVGFLLSDAETLTVAAWINVDPEATMRTTDASQKRSPKDRMGIYLNNRPNPRDMHPLEHSILTHGITFSPSKQYMHYETSVSFDQMKEICENEEKETALIETCKIYEENTADKQIKNISAMWAIAWRAVQYFKEVGRLDDLIRYLNLVFNSRAIPETAFDGWAKHAADAISIYDKEKAKNTWSFRQDLYITLNEYLYRFFRKDACPEKRPRINNSVEHFMFPEEEAARVSEDKNVDQEVEMVC